MKFDMSFDFSLLSVDAHCWFTVIVLAAIGSCVGSFANVVIYRIPRGLSIISPPSSCPSCNRRIYWFDNIPVISYLLLGGKCRFCKTAISPRYTLVEIATAIAFVGLYDAFYVMRMHSWFGMLPFDIPLFVGHLGLVTILIICSVMDIEYYLIDIRITFFAFGLGAICWAMTPISAISRIYGANVIGGAGFAGIMGAIVGLIIRGIMLKRKFEVEYDKQESQEGDKEIEVIANSNLRTNNISRSSIVFLAIYILGSILIFASLMMCNRTLESYKLRMWGYCVWLFLAIVAGSIPQRESDEQIVEVIESEKHSARSVALTEFIYLTPIILGFLLFWLMGRYVGLVNILLERILDFRIGAFVPIRGLAFSLAGILISSAFGWAVRIIFTLMFGKEAMGAGDIYILSAIGAIAGPAVAILGFFIGSVIGVFGICVLLLWKTSRALSYGPWISIGAFVCMLGYNPIMNYLKPAAKAFRVILLGN